jgi:hypothetical protein
MDKKTRIQLFDANLSIISDRLVSQDLEFNTGPKEPHDGPIRIELSLFTAEDVSKSVTYLQKLSGQLPIEVKELKKRGRKPLGEVEIDSDDRLQVLTFIQGLTNQDQVILELTKLGFKFMTLDLFEAMGYKEGRELPEGMESGKYQLMLKCLKQAKDPKNDKYDPELIFGIKLLGDKTNRILTYLQGESDRIKLNWDKPESFDFKKTAMMKFPEYMTLEEREKWRREHRLYKLDPEKEKSKFYSRWAPFIEAGEGEI